MSQTKKVTIAGSTYPMRLTMGAMIRFKRESGKEITEASSIEDMITCVHSCIKSASNADKVEFGYTVEELGDLLTPDQFTELCADLFPQSGESHESDQSKKK